MSGIGTGIVASSEVAAEYAIGFQHVIGQKLAVEHLQNALRTGRVSQAYLIHGEKGSGKLALAQAFAAALVCEHPVEQDGLLEPCGTCHSCHQMATGSHPDVILATAERAGVTTKTKTLGVQLSRFIQSDVAIKPYEGDWKIYIIPEADRLNQQAQNALLKTLEEPPAYAVFLLLTDNLSAFLPTILSRCVTLQLHPAREEELVTFLEQCGVEHSRAVLDARLSHGNPGRCTALEEEELRGYRERLEDFLERLKGANSHQIVVFAGETAGGGKEELPSHMEDLLDFGRSWYRDILVMKSTGNAASLIFQDRIKYISNIAMQLSYEGLEQIQLAFDEAARRLQSKENETQVAELLLLAIRRALRG